MRIIRKFFFAFVLILIFHSSNAQSNKIVKYYDSSWNSAAKETAFYYSEFVPHDNVYSVTSYFMKSNKLYGKATSSDTLFTKLFDSFVKYNETGQVEDSAFYYEDGVLKNTHHFYPNGNLWVRVSFDRKTKKQTNEGFDENGKSIPNFIMLREAELPGGQEKWIEFLIKNLNTKVPIKKNAPNGNYVVIVTFMVNKEGEILNIKPETKFGYGMEEEVIRVINKSPKWNPAIVFGKKENAFRRQPITFVVEDKK